MRQNNTDNKIVNILWTVFVIEAFLGGGGDVFSFSFVGIRLTLRMVLFIILLLKLLIIDKKIYITTTRIQYVMLILFVYCVMSLCIGIINHQTSDAIANFKAVSYMLIIFPLVNMSSSRNASFEVVGKFLIICATLISVASVVISMLVYSGVIDFMTVRIWLASISADLWIRNSGGFVYAGHLFVSMAAIMLVSKLLYKRFRLIYIPLLILFVAAILMSTTRGLIIAFFAAIVLIYLPQIKQSRNHVWGVIFIVILGVATVKLTQQFDFSRALDFTDNSFNIRLVNIAEGMEQFWNSPIWGQGYGFKYSTRITNSFEISLFDILIKQGLLGVLLWLLYIGETIKEIRNINKLGCTDIWQYYFSVVSILMMFIQSFTNPYLNNSVGMALVFITLCMNLNAYYTQLYKTQN